LRFLYRSIRPGRRVEGGSESGDECRDFRDTNGRRRHHAHDRNLLTPMPLAIRRSSIGSLDPIALRSLRLPTPSANWLDNRH
jgi:hypothetical protein